jgi:hypothetical protein
MEIQVINKQIVQKWMKDDTYGFEVSLEDIWQLIHHIIDNTKVSSHEIHEIADKLMIPYFMDNEILIDHYGEYEPGPKFEEFSDLIYNLF